jgi:hypothetical protein
MSRRNVLIRINTPEPARMWSGLGDLWVAADGIETETATYLGGGEILGGLDELEQLINGVADRLEISVSGVTAETVRLALEEAPDVAGADVDIGTIEFSDLWQTETVVWQAKYRADKLSVIRQAGSRTISLSMGSDDTGRSRAPNAYWTDADQRRRSPDDVIFDHVSGINGGTSRQFGPR